MSAGCYLYLSIGNLTQNVYNGKFFDVSNEDILTNAIVSQLIKCLKFMTWEGCFVIHVEYKYLSETLETFYHHQFYKR